MINGGWVQVGIPKLSWHAIDAGQIIGVEEDCQDSSVRGSTMLDMRPGKQVD